MYSFLFALQYLTRIPSKSITFDERLFGRSSMFFPVVGLILGGFLMLIDWLTGAFYPDAVRSAVLVISMVLLTGGIHLDGFMDTVDGIFGGSTKEKKMEIMRDSRVGAFSVLAVFCLLLIKYSFLAGFQKGSGFTALIMMAVYGRWAMTYALSIFSYARDEGIGKLFSQYTGKSELIVASLFTASVALFCGGIGGLIVFFITVLFAHMFCSYIRSVLGGLTGDTYGALNELTEVFVLAVYLPLYKYLPVIFNRLF